MCKKYQTVSVPFTNRKSDRFADCITDSQPNCKSFADFILGSKTVKTKTSAKRSFWFLVGLPRIELSGLSLIKYWVGAPGLEPGVSRTRIVRVTVTLRPDPVFDF